MTPCYRYALALLFLIALVPTRLHAQSCTPGEATAQLDVNNVRAGLHNQGGLFYPSSLYEVPKGSGLNALFAGGLWVGGMVDGELRLAASTYAQFGTDYEWFPGPLQEDGTPPNPDDCSAYDRIWTITQADLDRYEQTGEATDDLAEWPAELGAPVVDGDGIEGNYDLAAGDRPELVGDQMAWWIMNDAAGPHLTTEAEPMGMVLRVTAYAYDAAPDSPLFNTTFLRYRMTYRPTAEAPLEDAYFGHYADPDLGQYTDDYVGSDPSRDLAYVYNGDNLDEGDAGYGAQPPALGFVVLDGATEAARDLSHFLYFNGDASDQGNPSDAEDMYFFLQSHWKDGRPMTYGGDGFGDDLGLGETDYMYSGTPPFFWSEENTDGDGTRNVPADRRFVFSTGPFTMQPGETREVTVGIVWSQRANRLLSVRQLQRDVDEVQAFFDGVPYTPPPADPVPAEPILVSPPNGATVEGIPHFTWGTPGADSTTFYRFEVALDPDFTQVVQSQSYLASDIPRDGVPFEAYDGRTYYWRVSAENLSASAQASARSFTVGTEGPVAAGIAGGGAGIVEVANEAGPLLPEAWDTGGTPYGGNSVWHSLNADGFQKRYYVSAGGGGGDIYRLERYIAFASPRDFEMRFTDRGGYCVYAFEDDRIARVPFELWDIGVGTPEDPADDRRMIPLCLANGESAIGAPGTPSDWSDTFGASSPTGDTDPFFGFPISDWVFWMDPIVYAGGYDAFAAAAEAFGGAGAIYDLDQDPTGTYYANFYGGSVYPIGRFVLGDFDGSGAPPPSGTVIRIVTTKPDTLHLTATLSGLNLPDPEPWGDVGTVEATYDTALRLSGVLPAGYSKAYVGCGSLGGGSWYDQHGELKEIDLVVDPSTTARRFPDDPVRPPCAAFEGTGRGVFIQVSTRREPTRTLRGYLRYAPNAAPEPTSVFLPAAGTTLALDGEATTPLLLTWPKTVEPNGNPVAYAWQLARDTAFADLVLTVPTGTATSQTLTYATLDSALAQAGVPDGGTVRLYQRVVATDGSLATPGPASTLTLTRGTLVPTGTESAPPDAFALHASYPNPFREQATLAFDLPAAARVSVAVYDLLGRRVLSVPERLVAAGASRTLTLEAAGLASGVYLYRLEAQTPGQTWRATGRLVRVR